MFRISWIPRLLHPHAKNGAKGVSRIMALKNGYSMIGLDLGDTSAKMVQLNTLLRPQGTGSTAGTMAPDNARESSAKR